MRLLPAIVLGLLLLACTPTLENPDLVMQLSATQEQLVEAQQQVIDLTESLQASDAALRSAQEQCELVDRDASLRAMAAAKENALDDCYGQLGLALQESRDYRERYEACRTT